ncbi:MAG: biotin--[acetyl-CoA-carboxylase] ligase [Chloroflexi bacterium]|nr:biotin--[acetyl-CoA-carboxylase] ligase [Chloroflexota bacterium]
MGAPDRLVLLADPAVRSAIAGEFGREVEYYAATGSTQDRARQLADAGHPGALIVAEEQSSGRGRQGRSWVAQPGTSLLASWLFRPLPADPALFALLSGVAIARALTDLGIPEARLKWPNDVQLGGKKVAGVLADAVTGANGGALVLGIGVNVHQRDLGELSGTATSLAREARAADRLALLARIDRELRRVASDSDERRVFLEEWRLRSSTLGREVEVRSAGAAVRGFARSIADDGALVLETASGSHRVLAGEVFVA